MKARKIFNKILETVLAILIILMTVVSFIQVIRRYVFGSTFYWAEDLVVYAMVWMTFMGATVGVLTDANPKVDFFVRLLPRKIRLLTEAVGQLVCAGFIGFLSYNSLSIVKMNLDYMGAGLKVPRALFYASFPACGVLMVVFFLIRAGLYVREMSGKEDKQ